MDRGWMLRPAKQRSVKSLANRVFDTIRQTRMLAPGDRAGVAVSGGADSVALLRIMDSLRDRLGIVLIVLHFDHKLRGAESDADARFVAGLARYRGLDCVAESEDVSAAAASNKWNLEDAARRLRYAFFERVVQEGRASRILVAHTVDDQAETVLAHILRGTGPAGLAGIYPLMGSIVRPLLRERREELRDYLRGLGQDWREDSTNRDLSRQRARIREQLVPALERDFSPGAVKHLAGLADLAREEEVFWSALVEDRFRLLVQPADGKLTIRMQDLESPLSITRATGREGSSSLRSLSERLTRRIYRELRGAVGGLTASHVRQVLQLASDSASGCRAELPGGIVVEKVFDKLVFATSSQSSRTRRLHEMASEPRGFRYVVRLPERGVATISVPELNRRFCLKVIDWSVSERDTEEDSAALDADLLREPLILRSWRHGDAYRPRGRRQPKKLKEMFLAGRVPSGDRASWPVLECGGRVAWARGMPPAEEFCARDGTHSGMVIEETEL
jgi:tRNA(Ile)-lysidine synthase